MRVGGCSTRNPANEHGELVIKSDAICWWVAEDDSILDAAVRRWLLRLRKSMRRLAR